MTYEMAKRRRIDHVSRVNIDLANDLLMYKAKRNFDLQGTGLFCNLRPNKSKEACATCSNYKKCAKARNERAFIHKKIDAISHRRRNRKQNNPRRITDPELTICTDSDEALDFEYRAISAQYEEPHKETELEKAIRLHSEQT